MIQRFDLRSVQYMPTQLEPGLLYVAKTFGAAAHLCACGCGTIVRTPLNRWSLVETEDGPTVVPSIGNWQEPCRSHYLIKRGKVIWVPKWTREEVVAGRQREQQRLRAYYDARDRRCAAVISRFWRWLKKLF